MVASVAFEHIWWNWFIYTQSTFTLGRTLFYFNLWLSLSILSLSSTFLDIWHLNELVPVGHGWISFRINVRLTHFSSICRIFKTSGKSINISSEHALVIISHETLYFDGIMFSCEYDALFFVFYFRFKHYINDVICWSLLHWSLTLYISSIFRFLVNTKIIHAGCIHFGHLRHRILMVSTLGRLFALGLHTLWLSFEIISLLERCCPCRV